MYLLKNIYSGESGLDDDAYVLKQMKKQPGDLASNIRHFLDNPKQYQQDEPVTPPQALAMLLDIGLTEEDYRKLCLLINKNRRLLPPLHTLRREKKKCHPLNISPPSDTDIWVGNLFIA